MHAAALVALGLRSRPKHHGGSVRVGRVGRIGTRIGTRSGTRIGTRIGTRAQIGIIGASGLQQDL